MIRSLPLAILLLLAASYLHGQSTSSQSGATAHGMGYTSACLSDEWAILNNVAGLANVEATTAALSYTINTFLPGGNVQALAVNIPSKSLAFGMGAFSFGDPVYREQVITAGVANTFGLASLGIKLNYIQYRAAGFGQKGFLTMSMGGIAEISSEFLIGAHIVNINQPKYSDQEDERIPTTLHLGIRYTFSDKVLMTAELEKDIDFSPVFKMGCAYTPQEKITLRTGFNLNPNAAFIGAGFILKYFLLDYAIGYRMEIGISHQASLGYQFRKK